MADPHVITALVKKRAEFTHQRLKDMILALEHMDCTLLMFDPDYKVEAIKPKAFRPPEDWSKRGEMTRIILGILRKAAEPMTARDIAIQLVIERALDQNDERLLRLMTKRCGVALRGLRDRGITTSGLGPGQCVLWELAH